ncbi:unnamed protein product [Blepharisma stoltei]|uniref:PAS domain-containing protein n=1 Tax=Blepharisma stoltei TaxID=1481888 RepID=A0AAU9IQL2_9CILI|nr:unnamed protein product [Blepharisma stoltei]
MISNSKDERNYFWNFSHFEKPSFMRRMQNLIFSFFGEIYEVKYSGKTKWTTQLIYEIFINVVISLQMSSLAWYPNLSIDEWESYHNFWVLIGVANYSEICGWFNTMDLCFYGTISTIGACLASFIAFGVFFYFEKKPPSLLIIVPRKIAGVISTVCFIPTTIILLMILKYSTGKFESVDEFTGSVTKNLNFGPIGMVFSILCLLVLIPMAIFTEVFSCDIRHSKFRKNIKARSSAALDLQRKLFYASLCVSYITLGVKNAIIHQIFWFCCSFFVFIKILWLLHFFNYIENAIHAYKFGSTSLIFLIFIFGSSINNSLITLTFTLILQPIAILLIFHYTKIQYQKLKNNSKIPRNQYDFERKFRHLLTDQNSEDKANILKLFNQYSKLTYFKKDKLFVEWEFNYCLHTLKDERLARVILAKAGYCESSFESSVYEWRILEKLKNKANEPIPEFIYLEYLNEFGKTKYFDKKLCYLIIQLQTEFSSKSPRFKVLVDLTNRASKCMEKVKSKYSSIIEKYANIGGFELYASFLENIEHNYEESDKINKRKSGIEIFNQKNQSLDRYGRHLGIILASSSKNSLGLIVYINEKAAEVLKVSLSDVIGTSVFNFLPEPYNQYHSKTTKNFLSSSKSVEVPYHQNLFLETHRGFLVECNMLIKLTAYNSDVYYIISFIPKITSKQIALISESGAILSHSEAFPRYLGLNEKCLKHFHIEQVVPCLEINKMKIYEPVLMRLNIIDIALVRIDKQINSKTLIILYLLHEQGDIKRWKEGKDEDQISHYRERERTIEENSHPKELLDHRRDTKYQQLKECSISFRLSEIENLPELSENENKSVADNISVGNDNHSHSSIKSRHAQHLIVKTSKKIKVLQWVLLAITLTIISTMIAVISNMISNVNLTSSMSIFYKIGDILYNFGISADLARLTDREKSLSYNYTTHLSQLLEAMEALKESQSGIISDLEQWKFCENSKIANSPLIPIWEFDQKFPKTTHKNIYDTISDFIFNIQSMSSAINENQSYKNYTQFIVMNGIGRTYNYLNQTIFGFENCEADQVHSTGLSVRALLISGFITVIILVLIILWFIGLVAKQENEFWNFVLNNIQIPITKWKSEAIDRLILVHDEEIMADESNNSKHIHKKIKTGTEIRHSWKIAAFFAISASYYILVYLYLYPTCEKYMINRPKLLNNFNMKRSLVSRVSIFSRDILSSYFIASFPNSCDLINSIEMANISAHILRQKNSEIRESKFMEMLSDELKQKIFEETNFKDPELAYGSEIAIETTIYDSISLGYVKNVQPTVMQPYLAMLRDINNEIGIELEMADRDSNNIINHQLGLIILVTIIYCLTLCGLLLFYYLPYFHNESKELQRLSVLSSVLALANE